MTRKSRQKFTYLENGKSFEDEINNNFHHFKKAFIEANKKNFCQVRVRLSINRNSLTVLSLPVTFLVSCLWQFLLQVGCYITKFNLILNLTNIEYFIVLVLVSLMLSLNRFYTLFGFIIVQFKQLNTGWVCYISLTNWFLMKEALILLVFCSKYRVCLKKVFDRKTCSWKTRTNQIAVMLEN